MQESTRHSLIADSKEQIAQAKGMSEWTILVSIVALFVAMYSASESINYIWIILFTICLIIVILGACVRIISTLINLEARVRAIERNFEKADQWEAETESDKGYRERHIKNRLGCRTPYSAREDAEIPMHLKMQSMEYEADLRLINVTSKK